MPPTYLLYLVHAAKQNTYHQHTPCTCGTKSSKTYKDIVIYKFTLLLTNEFCCLFQTCVKKRCQDKQTLRKTMMVLWFLYKSPNRTSFPFSSLTQRFSIFQNLIVLSGASVRDIVWLCSISSTDTVTSSILNITSLKRKISLQLPHTINQMCQTIEKNAKSPNITWSKVWISTRFSFRRTYLQNKSHFCCFFFRIAMLYFSNGLLLIVRL